MIGHLWHKIQATTRTTEDGIPELTRIPENMATTKGHFLDLKPIRNSGNDYNTGRYSYDGGFPLF